MKQLIITLVAVFALTLGVVNVTHAQMGMMGGTWGTTQTNSNTSQELRDTLSAILSTQNISDQSKVDCSKVTDDQFEKLGDAYMGTMFASTAQHEAMDNMMGGEGSASLRQAHINMGRSYLGCWSNYNSGPIAMPMMGYGGGHGMMGTYGYQPDITRSNYHNNMMGYGFNGFGGTGWLGGGLVMGLFWLLLIVSVVALVRMAMHRGGMHHTATTNTSAIDILKERYAKGEIDKEEFESKKKDLV